MASALRYAVDLRDDAQDAARLAAAHAPGEGRLVVRHAPGRRTRHGVACDIARTLGVRQSYAGWRGADQQSWEYVRAWLTALPIREMFVTLAHLLTAEQWTFLVELALMCDLDLTLVVQGTVLTRAQEDVCHNFGVEPIPFDMLIASIPARKPHLDRPERVPFPEVPRSHFLYFERTVSIVLEEDDLQQVRSAFKKATERFHASMTTPNMSSRSALFGLLRRFLADARDLEEATMLIRAAQKALFMYGGRLLRVDDEKFAFAGAVTGPPKTSEETYRSLRGYLRTGHAAAAAARLATGASVADLIAITMDDVAKDGTSLRVGGKIVHMSDSAAIILRAHRSFRAGENASRADPYFVARPRNRYQVDLTRISARGFADTLRRISRVTQIDFGLPHKPRHDPISGDSIPWATQCGFRIEFLQEKTWHAITQPDADLR